MNINKPAILLTIKVLKNLSLWFIFISILFPIRVSAKVYKVDIHSVEARMISPVLGCSETFSSLPAAQSSMLAKGANQARFSFSIKIPETLCSREDVGLYLGVIYDQDRVFLNGNLIGITADPENVNFRKITKPRLYLIPKRLVDCNRNNLITVDARRLVGNRLGPLGDKILLGPWWELEIISDYYQEYLLFFREIGVLIFSFTLILVVLFRKYSQNKLHMAFVSFSFWAGLMCVSLSGWPFTLINYPKILYSLHAVLVCGMLVELNRLQSIYAETPIFPKLSHLFSGLLSFGVFSSLFIFLPSAIMVKIYRFILLGFIGLSVYFLFRAYTKQSIYRYPIQMFFLLLIIVSVMADTSRIWNVHTGPNISPYFIGISVVGLGLVLARDLVEVFKLAANTQRIKDEKEYYEILSKLAQQVAHDIRSPLSALDSVVKDTAYFPEEKRIIVRSAVSRIKDIANDLLDKYRQKLSDSLKTAAEQSKFPDKEPSDVYLLSSIIEPVVTEKRLQFRDKSQIEIDFEPELSSYGLFAMIQITEFKRVLSNLINNAVEAFKLDDRGKMIEADNKCKVEVSLSGEKDKIFIKVKDYGKGIPPDILAKLGQKGETYGKAQGSGLGLYHARTSLENWGGNLNIQSEVDKGTTVILTLPQATPPEWFVSRIEITPNSPVIILDDDISIHQVWKSRLESLRIKEHGIRIFSFSSPEDTGKWIKTNIKEIQKAVYLFDYELIGHRQTGISFAEEFDIANKTILVTSRYEEPHIIEGCIRIGMRMIPKSLAGLVPILIVPEITKQTCQIPATKERENLENLNIQTNLTAPCNDVPVSSVVVLIDDDSLVHMTWKMKAKSAGITLKAYKGPKEFLANVETIAGNTPIYIDSELGDGIKGEDIAKVLHEKGFTEIYLETGHPPENFTHLSFIKKVISKEPPWE